MEFVNWIAILVATVSAFVLGYFWYHPMLFGKKWQRENQLTDEALQSGNMGKIFGNAFLMTLVYSLILAKTLIRTDYNGMADGLKFGFMIGIGIAAMGLGVIYQFSRKSSTLFLIDAGYLVLSSTVIGAILGAMG